MITSLVMKNAVDNFSSSLAIDTNVYPLRIFHWNPEMDGADIGKMQAPGRHSWRKDVRHMPIDMEGTILATDTSAYWTARKALVAKATHDPANLIYDPIKFELTLDGDGEVYYAFCVCESWAAPLDVAIGSPTISEFQGLYSCRAGFWKTSSGAFANF
jgi:hypothetical protein